VLEDDVTVESHSRIAGRTTLKKGVHVHSFAAVGGIPQDLKYHGEPGRLIVGEGTIIREGATLHIGTEGGGMATEVGDRCLLMAYSHVAHDCKVGNGVILANGATLAGHVEVGDSVIVGGLAAIHQFTRIGAHAFISGGSMVTSDILPFCTAQGDRANLVGLNTEGMRRRGFDGEDIKILKRAYRTLFRSGLPLQEALEQLEREEAGTAVGELLAFARKSHRGLARPRSQ
jgi:UDP-N-acetylglucosamine acyltransferase